MEQVETISVKGMVCSRCIITLKQAITDKGMRVASIELGKISVYKTADFSYCTLTTLISILGFEILLDKQVKIIERIKESVVRYVSSAENKQKFSEVLSDELNMNFDQLSGIFSSREGMTLEHYIIKQKIEKVKGLLTSTEDSVTDISYQVNYSSVQHLSRQFKEIIGVNPSRYRELAQQKRYKVKQ
ncbi:AraC family transcriptional regulator [Sphingobacteriaceae bacterium]|nr:AraC family transcriptional regulator [Sphingobacteriaceae bacterium]